LAVRASETWERLEDTGPGLIIAWEERAKDGRVRYAMAGLGLGLLAGSLLGNQFGILPALGRVSGVVYWAGRAVPWLAIAGIAVGLFFCAVALLSRWAESRDWEYRRRRVNARLRAKAAEDPVFRQHLKADPRGTFDCEFGSRIRVPPGFEVTVVEETPAHWYLVLPPAGTRLPGAWAVRAEDGRIDYAYAGFGVALIVGSLVSIASDNMQWFNWTGFGWAPLAFLSATAGLVLFAISLYPKGFTDQDWGWERRPMTADRYLITKAVKDPRFRKDLKAHPRRVFDRELKSKLRAPVPDGFEITVLEETPTHEYIVLWNPGRP
jgi:hypothetical protein